MLSYLLIKIGQFEMGSKKTSKAHKTDNKKFTKCTRDVPSTAQSNTFLSK